MSTVHAVGAFGAPRSDDGSLALDVGEHLGELQIALGVESDPKTDALHTQTHQVNTRAHSLHNNNNSTTHLESLGQGVLLVSGTGPQGSDGLQNINSVSNE